ncbi:hypothetical protein OPT61_g4976 [Boeremia exigua]|uniref:Uncharacterized protein n=1 Tax=Boeremia exigua TaxID=749465 RepID=A0ACC2IC37_9PLEO|nr:hypothetical protein OPT61_g4976 [Boeremia exigua]
MLQGKSLLPGGEVRNAQGTRPWPDTQGSQDTATARSDNNKDDPDRWTVSEFSWPFHVEWACGSSVLVLPQATVMVPNDTKDGAANDAQDGLDGGGVTVVSPNDELPRPVAVLMHLVWMTMHSWVPSKHLPSIQPRGLRGAVPFSAVPGAILHLAYSPCDFPGASRNNPQFCRNLPRFRGTSSSRKRRREGQNQREKGRPRRNSAVPVNRLDSKERQGQHRCTASLPATRHVERFQDLAQSGRQNTLSILLRLGMMKQNSQQDTVRRDAKSGQVQSDIQDRSHLERDRTAQCLQKVLLMQQVMQDRKQIDLQFKASSGIQQDTLNQTNNLEQVSTNDQQVLLQMQARERLHLITQQGLRFSSVGTIQRPLNRIRHAKTFVLD